MKRLRTQITSSIGGGLRRGLGALTSLRGLALGGLAGFGAGKATSIFRNLSPKFNKAFEELSDVVQSRLTVVAAKLAPLLEDFANWIAKTITNADVAAAMDWLVPKIRLMGDMFLAAIDGVKLLIKAIQRVPLVLKNLGANATAAASAGYNAATSTYSGTILRPYLDEAGARVRRFFGGTSEGVGASLRKGAG